MTSDDPGGSASDSRPEKTSRELPHLPDSGSSSGRQSIAGSTWGQLFRDGIQALSASFARKDTCSRKTSDDAAATVGELAGGQPRPGSISVGLGRLIVDGLNAISGGIFKGAFGASADLSAADEQAGPERSQASQRAAELARALRRTLEFATLSSFSGESIHRDVPPETHVVQPGEKLAQIAQAHLGPSATAKDVGLHVEEIRRLNQVRQDEELGEGKQLILPGHTADGGTVLRDADGSRHTRWPDGVERVEREDGSGYARRTAGDSSFSERHWGPRPEHNYDLTRTADGRYRIDGVEFGASDRRVARAMWFTQSDLHAVEQAWGLLDRRLDSIEQLQQEGEQTEELKHIRGTRANMREFRLRALHDCLPPEQVARTCRELDEMLQSDATAPTSKADRMRLVEEISRQSAHPHHVSHGHHHTSHIAALEARAYARNPAIAAQLVREVSLTGHYTDAQRALVEVLPQGNRSFAFDGDFRRSYASQLFQLTAVNVHWTYNHMLDAGGQIIARAGQIVYEQCTPFTDTDGAPATGERLMDYSRTPPEPPSQIIEPASDPASAIDNPNLVAGSLTDISNRILGASEQNIVLANERLKLANTRMFRDAGQLESLIAKMKEEGTLPAIVEINSAHEPFWTDSGSRFAGGHPGWHMLTITDYDPQTHRVSVDNQWTPTPRIMTVRDLFASTMPPGGKGSLARLRTGELRALDLRAELELLWQQRNENNISNERFGRQMASLLNRSHSDMLRVSSPEAELNHRQFEADFGRVFTALPVEEQESVALQLDSAVAPSLLKTLELMRSD